MSVHLPLISTFIHTTSCTYTFHSLCATVLQSDVSYNWTYWPCCLHQAQKHCKQLTSRQDTWHSARMYHLLLLPSKNFTTLRKSNRICWNAQHCLERHTQKSHLLQVSCVELTTLKTQILPSVFTNDRRNSDRKVAYVECRRLWFYEEKICFIWHRWCDLTRGFDPQLEKLQPQHRCSIEKSAGVAFWPRLTKKIKGSQAIVSSHHLNLKKKSQTWLFPRLHSCILM